MLRWPSSLRARLTLWYSILLGLPLVAFAVATWLLVARTLESRTDGFVADALTAFSRELVAERRAPLPLQEAMRRTLDEVRFRGLDIAIEDSTGAVLARTRSLALTLPEQPGPFRVTTQTLEIDGLPLTVVGTYDVGDLAGTLDRLQRMFLVAVPLLIAAAAAGGYGLARRNLAPVATMAARAREITASNLDERLPVEGARELAGLAQVVNDLLDRLERAFAQQARFVADASHELRTPTAIVRTEAEVTLSQTHRDEADYRNSMGVVQDAAGRLTRIVDDLFLLARADAGHLVSQRTPLYLEDVVHHAARSMHSVAARRGIRLEMGKFVETPVEGDADLLGRVLLNLLDNAVKHSPAGGTVEISMSRRNRQCEIQVVDAGPGIPADLHERVFERFFRADSSRARAEHGPAGGAGLGLAIARRIAEMHDGRLDLRESRPGRTAFILTLPLHDSPPTPR